MTSVWKRLQRVGKKASKFQFTASYQSLTVECVRGGKWQPNKLVVVWTRRKRRKLTKPMSWQPGISNPFRGIIVWPEPDPVDINVTLYKDSKPDSQFEDKEWTFVIEDESPNGRRKPIATGNINMVDYVSVESRTFDVTLTMKVASKKLVSASLEFNLTCVLIKEGMATDDDMISIGSMMSLGEGYYLDDNDDDMEVAPSPRPTRHRRNLSQGNVKVPAVTKVQEAEDGRRSLTPNASPILATKRSRIRSKSALGENTKTLISDVQKEEGMKRLSTGSDVSAEISDNGQESSKDKNKMETELIKWARTCTKGYRGVKVKNMTTSWRDGLAFCAVLHHFHPDKIDFTSLDPHKIKDNNKLAFTAFEKLGIPRLLDPTQMMFSPVPDKLSVMTYVFQIKTHFSRQQALPRSPLSLESSSAPRRLPPTPQVTVTATKEEPEDQDDAHVADIDDSVSKKQTTAKGSEEGYNPFLDDEEENKVDSATPEIAADHSASRLGGSKERKSSSDQEAVTKSSSASEEDKRPEQESSGKKNDVLVKSKMKPPPKPPRLHENTNSSPSVDTSSKTSDKLTKKDESKGYNPFDEDESEEVVVSKKAVPSSKSTKSSKGYNPFDDEDDDSQEQNLNDNETKSGYNPFDDDDDTEDVTQTETVVDQNSAKKSIGVINRRVSYPHDFNPFDEDDDLRSAEADESSQRTESKEGKVDKEAPSASTTKSYNPFDDDNVEGVSDDVGATDTSQSDSSTRKSSTESKGKVNKAAESGAASPSGVAGLAKPTETHKKRRAPPPPAVRSSDDPWTARLPEDATPRRRRSTKATTPKTGEQASPQTSPAKRGPKRAAPAPPRRPPLIPSFDEWKSGASTETAATGDNDKPAASSVAESSPSRKISPDTGDQNQKSDNDSGSQSPVTANKVSSGDGGNQADIKLLARQVLMDARKKAGASGALPRERVAEITKTSKGPTADKATTGSIEGEAGAEEMKVDDPEVLRKKEKLRLRKEELQRRKKAAEKAHIMVQNAIAKEKAQRATTSPKQTRTERKTQEGASDAPNPDATNSDQKPVGKKNLQHRPLKLKDKENDLQKRKLSAEKDAKSPPDKGGFKESEELQRIRQILNQGKKEKKPSTSENVDKETDAVQARSPGTSQEDKRKMSDDKSSKYTAVNGVKGSPTPTPSARPKVRGPNAGLHDYVESRKMNFEVFEVPPAQPQQNDEQGNVETAKDDTTDGQTKNEDSTIDGENQDSEDQTGST
ncbi:hypothetical protein ACROYT_G003486 [Oculina patagonica]